LQFSPTSCRFISLLSKYCPQNPVLKHPRSIFRIILTVVLNSKKYQIISD
jgi:hypothetical protein